MLREGGMPAWRDAQGTVRLVRDLTDRHLTNIILYLQRRHDLLAFESARLATDGSMEDAVDEYDLAGPEFTCSEVYPRLLEEALRRGLRVPPDPPAAVPSSPS